MARCVKSLFRHTENFELIAIDNGSKDGSAAYLKKLTKKYLNVKIILNRRNQNFGPACNQGVIQAEGENIICLNPDTIVTPHWAERLEARLKKHPRSGIVAPVSNNSAGIQRVADIITAHKRSKLDTAALQWSKRHGRKYREVECLYGWCLLIKRDFLEKEPYLFDSRFTNACEDDDLCLRARLRGFKLVIDFGTFIRHEGQAGFRKKAEFIRYYFENCRRNRRKFIRKWAHSRYGRPGHPAIKSALRKQEAACILT